MGKRKGPGEKGKLSCQRVLLTNRSRVRPPHFPSKGCSALRSQDLERRAGRVHPVLPAFARSKYVSRSRSGPGCVPQGRPRHTLRPPRAQQKSLVPGPWPQAPGPPFATGEPSAWLWAGPEAPSRKVSDSAPAKLPGRA